MSYPSEIGSLGTQEYPVHTPKPIELTPEELRVLKECSNEAIFQRAIPMGVVFGFGGLYGARSGILMSSKFGVKPAVIGLGILGYLVGRISYSSTCINRVLEVPGGNLKKMYELHKREYDEYTPAELPSDQIWSAPKRSSDIDDVAHTREIDMIPSEYYKDIPTETLEEEKKRSYKSYDDLREQNRQQYQKQNPYARNDQFARKPPAPQDANQLPDNVDTRIGGTRRSKYGDIWDAS